MCIRDRLTITNIGDRNLEIRGTGKITVGIPCDRCLEEVSTEIPLGDSSSRARVCEVEERGELCVPSVPMAGAASC